MKAKRTQEQPANILPRNRSTSFPLVSLITLIILGIATAILGIYKYYKAQKSSL